MRLTAKEAQLIKMIVVEELPFEFMLRLFGSRTDDNKAGGDIDLLLIVSSDNLEFARNKKFIILNRLYEKLGDQKIDLVIVTQQMIDQDQFLKSVENGVDL